MHRSPEALGARNPKNVSKGLPRPSGPECQKKCRKSPQGPGKMFQNQCSGTFLTLFWCSGPEGPRRPSEIFWGFRGPGVWRLLHMRIVIVTLLIISHPSRVDMRTRSSRPCAAATLIASLLLVSILSQTLSNGVGLLRRMETTKKN